MGALRIEDLKVGERIRTAEEIEVTAAEIVAFAQAYDPQPWHLSEEQARTTPFGSLVASGWHTAAMTMRLVVSLGLTGLIGASVNLNWPTPTSPGDRLHVSLRVTDKRDSRTKPDRQIVTIDYDTINQAGEVRQHTEATILVWHGTDRAHQHRVVA